MKAVVYILLSEEYNQFYTGSTEKVFQERLSEHLQQVFLGAFTSKANDWQPFLIIDCATVGQARRIELHIKKQKSSTYIKNLKQYPEMVDSLLKQFAKPAH